MTCLTLERETREIRDTISKTVDNDTPFLGENVIYTIEVINDGPSDATGVKIEDILSRL